MQKRFRTNRELFRFLDTITPVPATEYLIRFEDGSGFDLVGDPEGGWMVEKIEPEGEQMSEAIYSPDLNNGGNIFVFGSNEAGRHGKGAALTALRHWGAKHGQGFGRAGNSFAIPTKDARLRPLPLEAIRRYVADFIDYAKGHQELSFLVTRVGCGLAGYSDDDIKPMFVDAPRNCRLPDEWRDPTGTGTRRVEI
jgi:hypothetical protein